MTTHPLHPLADAIARAIFAAIESDRCCNLENIRDAAFRELAVAEASKMLNAPVPVADGDFVHAVATFYRTVCREPELRNPSKAVQEAAYPVYKRLCEMGIQP